MALTNPAVKAWDPAFAYELAYIIEHGIHEMWGEDKDVIYYVTAYNENYPMPPKPEGCDEGIIKGLYKFQDAKAAEHTVRLIGSGAIMKQALDAVDMLAEYGVGAEIWSATSYGELHRDAVASDRAKRLGGEAKSWVEECLGDGTVTVAVSDNMTAYPKLIDPWVGGTFTVLGADGFGRSDTRENLRRFFEIDEALLDTANLVAQAAVLQSGFDLEDGSWCFDGRRDMRCPLREDQHQSLYVRSEGPGITNEHIQFTVPVHTVMTVEVEGIIMPATRL